MKTIPQPKVQPTPVATHLHPCAHCPSAHGHGDPESEDILKAGKECELWRDFPCAWRPEKFCQGWAKEKWNYSKGDLNGEK